MLLSLPEHILVRLIACWVSVVEISRLDEAYCNRSLRKQFHHVLSLPALIVRNPYDITIGLNWFTARGLRSSSLFVARDLKLSAVTQYLITVGGNHIRSIHMTKAAENALALLPLLAALCTGVEVVNFKSYGGFLCMDVLLRQSRATLTSINITDCKLDDCALLDGLYMPRLRRLCLSVNAFAAVLARFLKLSDQLKQFHLRGTQFDDSCADLLHASAKSLQMLDLTSCKGLSDSCLDKLAKDASELQLLSLDKCSDVTEQSLLTFVTHCPKLVSVLFTGPTTDATLIAIAEHCGPRLRHLALSNVECTGDTGVDALTQRCTNIESLRWASTGVSMPALCRFIRAQSRLVELSLGGCKNDDAVLKAVTAHGSWLKRLGLYSTTGYTDQGLRTLARLCPALQVVYIEVDSALLSPSTCAWWQLHRPQLSFKHAYQYPSVWVDRWKQV